MNSCYRQRQAQLREVLHRHGLNRLLLFSNRSDTRYSVWASGGVCRSSGHYLMIDSNGVKFVEVSYRAHELRQSSGMEVVEIQEETFFADFFGRTLKPGERIGLAGVAPAIHFIGSTALLTDISEDVDQLLLRKSEKEISLLSELACRAAEIVDESWQRVSRTPDVTEEHLARELRSALMMVADQFAFPLSLVSGQNLLNSTIGSPTNRKIGKRDACVIDFGVTRNGLTIDLTRMYFRSEQPLSLAYASLTKVLHESLPQLEPGMLVSDWIEAFRRLLRAAELPDDTLELPDLGHGIGFGLHEPPFIGLKPSEQTRLEVGMVLCIEPEIRVNGLRLRREEMVVIESSGGRLISGHPIP